MEKGKFQSLTISQIVNLMLQFEDMVRLRHGSKKPHYTQERLCLYCLICQGRSFAECGLKLFEEDLFVNKLNTVDSLDVHEMFDRYGYYTPLTHEHVNAAGRFRSSVLMVLEQQQLVRKVLDEFEDMPLEELREYVMSMPPCKEAAQDPPAIIKKEAIKKHFTEQYRKDLAGSVSFDGELIIG